MYFILYLQAITTWFVGDHLVMFNRVNHNTYYDMKINVTQYIVYLSTIRQCCNVTLNMNNWVWLQCPLCTLWWSRLMDVIAILTIKVVVFAPYLGTLCMGARSSSIVMVTPDNVCIECSSHIKDCDKTCLLGVKVQPCLNYIPPLLTLKEHKHSNILMTNKNSTIIRNIITITE